jgi:hypothetical protein
MPALRQPVKRPRTFWLKWIAAVAFAAAAIFDWSRAPEKQVSVKAYERMVLGGYRRFVRPVSSKVVRCRFRPTCSAYSAEAVRTHGLPKGAWLSFKRVVRCNPWVSFGTDDPVPKRS